MFRIEEMKQLVNFGADITIAAGHPEVTLEQLKGRDGEDVVKIDNPVTGNGYTFRDLGGNGYWRTNGWGSSEVVSPNIEKKMLGELLTVTSNQNQGIAVNRE